VSIPDYLNWEDTTANKNIDKSTIIMYNQICYNKIDKGSKMTVPNSTTTGTAKVQKPVGKKALHQAAINMSQSDEVKSVLAKMKAKNTNCDCNCC